MHHFFLRMGGAVTGLLLLSCEPEVAVTGWTAVPYAEIVKEIMEPSGQVFEADPAQTATEVESLLADNQTIGRVMEIVFAVYHQVEFLLRAVESSSGGAQYSDSTHSGDVSGTTAYVRISCFGPNITEPNLDFQYGELYVEGPSFSIEDAMAASVVLDGDIYGEFRNDCTLGADIVTGIFPGYISDLEDSLLLDFNLTVQRKNRTAERFQFPILLAGRLIQVLLRTAENGNYVLGFGLDDRMIFSLGTEKGFYQCEIGLDGISCGLEPTPQPEIS